MPTLPATHADVTTAYLERYPELGGPVERVSLAVVPLTVGRDEAADYTIYASVVSKIHATLLKIGDRYAVRDLESTNGTFVNGQRVVEQILTDGDIVHFAQVEFCFRCPQAEQPIGSAESLDPAMSGTQVLRLEQPVSLIRSTSLLRELMRYEAVNIVFQPIVNLQTSEVVGMEALGRGTHPGLPTSPAELLVLAERCGLATDVSQLLRRVAVRSCEAVPGSIKLFLNVHPSELADLRVVEAIVALAPFRTGHELVIEIPETAVTDVTSMARLHAALRDLAVEVAYDDFGTGQTRLVEMTAVPPHYLKFDKTMIQGIETAPPRQDMVAALVRIADTLGVQVIAEGIETAAAADVCRKLGCYLGQGYLLSPPTGGLPAVSDAPETYAGSVRTRTGAKERRRQQH